MKFNHQKLAGKEILNDIRDDLLDPLASKLIGEVEWLEFQGLNVSGSDLFPVVISGEGPPVLMLHGFDSSFLEFRRLLPLINQHNEIFIPDLYGFGFCPRPVNTDYGPKLVLDHLTMLLEKIPIDLPIGVIGASMGCAVAMELARRNPGRINRLLLLLTNDNTPFPKEIIYWIVIR